QENLGFAGGNNLAIRQCKGELIMLLNNDTLPEPNFLEPLPKVFHDHPKAGIVSSKLEYFDHPGVLQFAGSKGMNPYTGRSFSIGCKEQDQPEFMKTCPSALAHGAAMTIRRSALEQVGLIWEGYFLYYEEVDFCERCKAAGFEIW